MPQYFLQSIDFCLHFEDEPINITREEALSIVIDGVWEGPVHAEGWMEACEKHWMIGPAHCDVCDRCHHCEWCDGDDDEDTDCASCKRRHCLECGYFCSQCYKYEVRGDTIYAVRDISGNIIIFMCCSEIFNDSLFHPFIVNQFPLNIAQEAQHES